MDKVPELSALIIYVGGIKTNTQEQKAGGPMQGVDCDADSE